MDSSASPHLDGHGIFTVIVFSIVSIIVNYPLKIPIPFFISNLTSRLRSRLLSGKDVSSDKNLSSDSSNGNQSSNLNVNSTNDPIRAAPSSLPTLKKKRSFLTINHVSIPLIGVLFLLITRSIDGQQIKDGIIGTSGIEPLDILALFISLAYIAISLDATGLLRFLAFKICFLASGTSSSSTSTSTSKSKSSGYTLFLFLYLFFWVLGVLVGNDPVILSGTSFLIYLTRVAGISPPSAWIWSQFVAANISSAVLVSSNPTNLVVANGFGISFTTYTAFMILPSAISAAAGLLVILLVFRNKKAQKRLESSNVGVRDGGISKKIKGMFKSKKEDDKDQIQMNELPNTNNTSSNGGLRRRDTQTKTQELDSTSASNLEDEHGQDSLAPLIYIPTSIVPPDVNPRSVLLDPIGAIFGTVIMSLTLILLVVTSVLGGVKVYMVAVPGAAVCLTRDLVADYLRERKIRLEKSKNVVKKEEKKSDSNSNGTNGHREEVDQEILAIEKSIKEENNRRLEMSNGSRVRSKKEDEIEEEIQVEELTSNPEVSSSSSIAQILPKIDSRLSSKSTLPIEVSQNQSQTILSKILSFKSKLAETFPTVTTVLSRLPFPLLPFALGYFILVESLAHVGFINIMARGLGKVCSNGPTVAGFFVSALAVVLCNVSREDNLVSSDLGIRILLS